MDEPSRRPSRRCSWGRSEASPKPTLTIASDSITARRKSATPGAAVCTMKACSRVANWTMSGPVCGAPAADRLLSVSKPTCPASDSRRCANTHRAALSSRWIWLGGRAG
jgi:hypothetical protein